MKKSTFEKYVTEYCEDLTEKANTHRCKHASVLTYDNVIISSGVNVNFKNEFTKKYNDLKALHAESVAIMRAINHHHKIISKCELWVCRNNEQSKYSRPCPMCMKIIKQFNIRTVHYTDETGNWVKEKI